MFGYIGKCVERIVEYLLTLLVKIPFVFFLDWIQMFVCAYVRMHEQNDIIPIKYFYYLDAGTYIRMYVFYL